MDTKHASVFEYQDEWRNDRPEVNLSQLIRQRLTILIPDDQIPDAHDHQSRHSLPTPIVGYGAGAGYNDFETTRVHLSLHPWQKAWIDQEPTFSFSVFVQGQLDHQLPDERLPEKRRESLADIGILAPPEQSTTDREQQTDSPPTDT